MKINVDGAFIQATKLGGWGFVVRDSAGEAVLAGAGGAADLHDALMAETVVCWKAVDAAVSHGMSRVQLETDSLMLQKGVLSVEMDQAPPGVIFQEIRTLIEEHFVHFECLHVPTICNSSAARDSHFRHESRCEFVGYLGVPSPHLCTRYCGSIVTSLSNQLIKGPRAWFPKKKHALPKG
jgi:hypothetical protein